MGRGSPRVPKPDPISVCCPSHPTGHRGDLFSAGGLGTVLPRPHISVCPSSFSPARPTLPKEQGSDSPRSPRAHFAFTRAHAPKCAARCPADPFFPKATDFFGHNHMEQEKARFPRVPFWDKTRSLPPPEVPSWGAQGRAVPWWHRLLPPGVRSRPVHHAVSQHQIFPSASPRRMGSVTSRPARCRRLELLICSSGAAAWPRASSLLHGRSGFRSHPSCRPAHGFLLPEGTPQCPAMALARHGLP